MKKPEPETKKIICLHNRPAVYRGPSTVDLSFIFFPDIASQPWLIMHNQLHCLLIDNDRDDQDIFILALQQVDRNILCKTADGGQQALELLRSEPSYIPSFIFIDMNMPLMNGCQCLSRIRETEQLSGVPIYMYSTSASPDAVAEAKALGATDFLVKPNSFSQLVKLLSVILEPRNMLL